MRISNIEVDLLDHMGSDLSVVNAARVSFHKESEWDVVPPFGEDYLVCPGDPFDLKLKPQDVGLIRYLAKHKHFSPFNHAFLTFRVKAPKFVARQLVKHKFMPWNEVSRRYVDEEPEFFIPEMRARAENVKQGSSDEIVNELLFIVNDGESDVHGTPKDAMEYVCEEALHIYNRLLLKGVAPEVARAILPLNTMTEWWWSGTLGAFADMLRLRLDPHAQYDSRIVAEKIYEHVEKHFPVSIKALLKE